MKVLKSLAVLALVFTLGACETKPKDHDPAAFLDAVKGKTAEDSTTGAEVVFSADGKTANSGGAELKFTKADSDLIGKYKDPGDGIWTFTLNADKQGGKYSGSGQNGDFTFK